MNINDIDRIRDANSANPYADIIPFELGIGFPFVTYSGFIPRSGEVLIFATPAYTFKDKEKTIGYTGKTSGFSFRVAKGVTVRTGGYGGKPIRDTVRNFNAGDLLITNTRIIFAGKDDSFEFPVDKISVVKPIEKNAILIKSGRSSKNIYIDGETAVYTLAIINYILKETSEGTDLFSEVKNIQNNITDKQLDLCSEVWNQINDTNSRYDAVTKKPSKPKKILKIIAACVLGTILLLIIIGSCEMSSYDGKDSGTSTNVSSYENEDGETQIDMSQIEEIISYNNHPRIGDEFEGAKAFYEGASVGNVRVVTISEYASIKRKLDKSTDDDTVLYVEEAPLETGTIGAVRINFYDSNSFSNLSTFFKS